jgi:hypothetical protein
MNPQPLLRSDDLLLIVPKLLENLPITLGSRWPLYCSVWHLVWSLLSCSLVAHRY